MNELDIPIAELGPGSDPDRYQLRLYVAGQTTKSLAAMANLKRVCDEHLAGRYDVEVVDLLLNPKLAAGDQILAIPTLIRRLPAPLKRIIGDLSDTEKVLVGLDIRPTAAGSQPQGADRLPPAAAATQARRP